MGFDCTYHYIKGRENILADCLSRLSEDLDGDQISRFLPNEKATVDDFILPILQCIPEETQPDTQNEQSETVPDPKVSVNNERQWFVYKFQILPNKNQKPTPTAVSVLSSSLNTNLQDAKEELFLQNNDRFTQTQPKASAAQKNVCVSDVVTNEQINEDDDVTDVKQRIRDANIGNNVTNTAVDTDNTSAFNDGNCQWKRTLAVAGLAGQQVAATESDALQHTNAKNVPQMTSQPSGTAQADGIPGISPLTSQAQRTGDSVLAGSLTHHCDVNTADVNKQNVNNNNATANE